MTTEWQPVASYADLEIGDHIQWEETYTYGRERFTVTGTFRGYISGNNQPQARRDDGLLLGGGDTDPHGGRFWILPDDARCLLVERPVTPTWEPVALTDLCVGDRIQWYCDVSIATIEGTVTSFARFSGVEVDRDDLQSGGGRALPNGRHAWILADYNSTDLKRLSTTRTEQHNGPAIMRLVFCGACARPTGELVEQGQRPERAYCDNCRDLPGRYARGSYTETEGTLFQETGDASPAAGPRTLRMTEPLVAEPEEHEGFACPHCANNDLFTLRRDYRAIRIEYYCSYGYDSDGNACVEFNGDYIDDSETEIEDLIREVATCDRCGSEVEFEVY